MIKLADVRLHPSYKALVYAHVMVFEAEIILLGILYKL